MIFWIVVTILALAVAAILARAVQRGRVGETSPAAYDLQVYRDQLKEVERDVARGVVSDSDAERIRTEISRKILAADKALQAETTEETNPKDKGLALTFGALIAALFAGGGLWVYSEIGAPGYPDLPLERRLAASAEARDNRDSQEVAEGRMPAFQQDPDLPAEFSTLLARLREAVKERPADLQGQQLLVSNEAAVGNFPAAADAQAAVIDIKGVEASAEDYVLWADLMITAAGGYVSQEAYDALRKALSLDPQDPFARYYMGAFMLQTDRSDVTFRLWRQLLEEGPADAPYIGPIRAQLEAVAQRAGVKYTLPEAAPVAPMLSGPTAEDMQNAAEMTPEERQEMIRGMVEGLNDRLAQEGGTAAEWARLIGALGNLGQTERAQAIFNEARQTFAGRPDDLGRILEAGEQAGLQTK